MSTSPPSASVTPVLQLIGTIAAAHAPSPRLTSASAGQVGAVFGSLSSAVSIVFENGFQALSVQVMVMVSQRAFGVV